MVGLCFKQKPYEVFEGHGRLCMIVTFNTKLIKTYNFIGIHGYM